jgi:cytochrome c biogenesis protein CcdA
MIPAISPDVFRDSPGLKRIKWGISVALYAAAALTSSASMGAALGWLGSLTPITSTAAAVVLAMCALLYGMHELRFIHAPHPQTGWQVPSGWRRFHPWVTATGYGAYLGLGVLHYTFATTFVVAVIWALALGDPVRSAVTMSAFGIGQTLPIAWVAGQVTSSDHAHELGCTVHQWQPVVHLLNGMLLLAASIMIGLALVLTS